MKHEICSAAIPDETLEEYWLGSGDEASDATSFEEHLLACAACAARLESLAHLGEGVRRAAASGATRVIVTPSFLEHAARDGLTVREYHVPAGGRVACTITPEDDLVVGRLAVELGGARRVDLALCDAGGTERERLRDIPVRPDAGEIVFAEKVPLLRTMGTDVLCIRVLAIDEPGERVVGEYTFAHTPHRPRT